IRDLTVTGVQTCALPILSAAQLGENEVWRRSERAVRARYSSAREPELHKLIIRKIIDNEVHDLVATSAKTIAESGVQSADNVRQIGRASCRDRVDGAAGG